MSGFREHLEKALSFIGEYQNLVDSHMVDFITGNMWEKCLPKLLRLELEQISTEEIMLENICSESTAYPQLHSFIEQSNLLRLENCDAILDLNDLTKALSTNKEDDSKISGEFCGQKLQFMKEKKSHEVQVLASIIAKLARVDCSLTIDAGAGKGYLSTHLSEKYGLPVLAIDSSRVNHEGAMKRQQTMKKKKSRSFNLVRHSLEHIDECTNFLELAKSNFPNWDSSGGIILAGLHTCGSLAQSTIKAFLSCETIRCLCVVACCYHLTEETLTGKGNFSRNARMLAQQSVERTLKKQEPLTPSLHYRSVLQVLLNSLGICEARIGRGAPLDDFQTYAKWALEKIGVPEEQVPSDSLMEDLYRSHQSHKLRMHVFQQMRVRMGSIIEAAILLDRVVFLEESEKCSKILLVRLFDPVLSPRCYAIIALK